MSVPLVYIAGPYSDPDPVENTHWAVVFASQLLDDGKVIPLVPHLTMLWHAIKPRPYTEWLAYDLELLARCDAVYRLPGQSSGGDAEIFWAHEHGLPVHVNIDRLYAWAKTWATET